jgi:hypothetical protein
VLESTAKDPARNPEVPGPDEKAVVPKALASPSAEGTLNAAAEEVPKADRVGGDPEKGEPNVGADCQTPSDELVGAGPDALARKLEEEATKADPEPKTDSGADRADVAAEKLLGAGEDAYGGAKELPKAGTEELSKADAPNTDPEAAAAEDGAGEKPKAGMPKADCDVWDEDAAAGEAPRAGKAEDDEGPDVDTAPNDGIAAVDDPNADEGFQDGRKLPEPSLFPPCITVDGRSRSRSPSYERQSESARVRAPAAQLCSRCGAIVPV